MIDVYDPRHSIARDRISELEKQVEVLKTYMKMIIKHQQYWDDQLDDLLDLKPLINPNLFDDVFVEKSI